MVLTPIRNNPPTVGSVLQSNPGDKVSSGDGKIQPIVAVLSRQMPLPQSQQLAGQVALVRVLQSGPGNDAKLDVNGQAINVKLPPGRMLTAGEMVTVAFALQNQGDDLSAGNTGGPRRVQDPRNLITPLPANTEDDQAQESPSFVDRLSKTARLLGTIERLTTGQPTQVSTQVMASMKQLATQIQNNQLQAGPQAAQGNLPGSPATLQASAGNQPANPLTAQTQAGLQARNTTALQPATQLQIQMAGILAKQVSAAVETSGLFYESHLQQWAQGQRSTDQLAREPQFRFGGEQVISEKGLDPSALAQSAKMVTAQLAVIDHGKVSVAMHGLFNLPVQVELEPDEHREDDPPTEQGEPVRPWVARLKLDMAHLGELHVRIRMVGSRCDVQISGPPQSKALVDPHWRSFQQAMEVKGLELEHGQYLNLEDAP